MLRSTIREHWTPLLGAALSWLLMDVTFYGTAEFKHEVADSLFAQKTGVAQVERDAWFALVVSVMALPGYVCACLFIDTVGRFRLQAVGFAMMTLFYLIMAASTRLGAALWVNLLIFSATFFWTNFGPNVTTYIVPSEIFPVASRTTCHGICAASGKIGAIVGAYFFPVVQSRSGLPFVMVLCAGIAALGLLCTVKLLPVCHIAMDTLSTAPASGLEMAPLSTLREWPGGKYTRLPSVGTAHGDAEFDPEGL
ncbi:hypothetical protein FOZ63_007891 [Perkinsus olseni]|uniref:Major facilitator superfamily (MFS) profile domain-containing protein n=1 Tax=Perkinsus olseni TaxID=32597 RepID=A0A7J6UN48_PEROL|nr:hypothetical protein FOZ63_007891 [Perkinsus olseni]